MILSVADIIIIIILLGLVIALVIFGIKRNKMGCASCSYNKNCQRKNHPSEDCNDKRNL